MRQLSTKIRTNFVTILMPDEKKSCLFSNMQLTMNTRDLFNI